MLRSPVMAQRMYDLLDYLRWHTSVPTKLNEFAILIQARLWRSQVEWLAHYPLALKAGLSAQVAADLKANKRPASMQDDEAAVYDFCMELATRHEVSDDTFERAKKLLGDQGRRRPHRGQRHLCRDRHAARRRGGRCAARQGAAIQAGGAVAGSIARGRLVSNVRLALWSGSSRALGCQCLSSSWRS